jgi:hypothetical protein
MQPAALHSGAKLRRDAIEKRNTVGAVQVGMQLTHSLKPPGFNH